MKRKLIFSFATVIAIFFIFSMLSFAEWNEDNTYSDDDGNLVTGAYEIEGTWYYFNEETGIPEEKYIKVNGLLYHFTLNNEGKSEGTLYTGFHNSYYYVSGEKFEPTSAGVCKIRDDYYYFTSYGKNIRPESAGVHKMGNGKYYYFNESGTVKQASKTGVRTINGKKYYFLTLYTIASNGKTSFKKIDGETYRIAADGHLIKGWLKIDGKKYYMSPKTYRRCHKGINKINGVKYYFASNGVMQTKKWVYKKGLKKFYFGKNGKMVKGCNMYIGKYKYYFNKIGVCQTNLVKYKGYNWVCKHALKVNVNRLKNTVTVYAKDGSKGYTIPVVAFICTTGSYDRPTDKGNYYTGAIYRWKELGGKTKTEDNGEKCYGQYVTHIYGNVYFHSVTCAEKGNIHTLYTGAYNWLGNSGSHGCVRLRCGDAYIIYNLAKRQSMRVHIYDSEKTGAFGKPVLEKISTNYDPTDPNL